MAALRDTEWSQQVERLGRELDRIPLPTPSDQSVLMNLDLDLDLYEGLVAGWLSWVRARRRPPNDLVRRLRRDPQLRRRLNRLIRRGRSRTIRSAAAQRLKYLDRVEKLTLAARELAERMSSRTTLSKVARSKRPVRPTGGDERVAPRSKRKAVRSPRAKERSVSGSTKRKTTRTR